jgi:hypothetical protein
MNVNDSVVKTKYDNLYSCRESIIDSLKRHFGPHCPAVLSLHLIRYLCNIDRGRTRCLENIFQVFVFSQFKDWPQ